jgi:hypothetical protein
MRIWCCASEGIVDINGESIEESADDMVGVRQVEINARKSRHAGTISIAGRRSGLGWDWGGTTGKRSSGGRSQEMATVRGRRHETLQRMGQYAGLI